MPRAGDLDLSFLAESFQLAGGAIRNIVVAAAYAAAEHASPLSMAHLIRATPREYLKMGRLCVESEFGPYYHLLCPTPPEGQGAGLISPLSRLLLRLPRAAQRHAAAPLDLRPHPRAGRTSPGALLLPLRVAQ